MVKTMTEIFVSSDNIVSPIGLTTAENFTQLKQNITGIKLHDDKVMSDQTFQAALFSNENFYTDQLKNNYTKFEKLLIASITGALANSGISAADKKTNALPIQLSSFRKTLFSNCPPSSG